MMYALLHCAALRCAALHHPLIIFTLQSPFQSPLAHLMIESEHWMVEG